VHRAVKMKLLLITQQYVVTGDYDRQRGRGEDGGRDLAPSPKINFGVATMAYRVPQSLPVLKKLCLRGLEFEFSHTSVGLNEQSYVDNIALS